MPEALPLQPGDPRRLGSFEITGRLGVGEQGAVFLGGDPAGGPVAVKVLHVRLSGEPVARSRFADAFTAARRVSGFCTAAILAADVAGDRPYVVSEWVDGPSLQQLVDEEGPRGGAVVERLAVGMAIALAAVHRAGALHHDLKPGNILLGRDGPRMCDFGIARALEAVNAAPTGRVTEDPAYKSPEQLRGMGIGPAADVFAWASTLVFAATGRAPFGDGSPSEVMQRIVYDDADLSALPDSVREVAAAALAKDPSLRPTAPQLLERLLLRNGALAGRMPPSMAAEGRALAAGAAATPSPAPSPVPSPRPPMGPVSPPGVVPGGPGPAFGRPEPVFPPPPGVPAGPPPAPPAAAPAPPPAPPAPPMPPPGEAEPPSLLGKLSKARRVRPRPEPEPEPLTVDLDPAAFEATTAFSAVGADRPEAQSEQTTRFDAVGAEPTATFDAVGAEPTATFDAVGAEPTATFDAIDLQEPVAAPSGPGLGFGRDLGERRSASLSAITRMRRPGNHVLGLVLSLVIGVGVGIAIIMLVLWPQLKDDNGPPPDSANASNNRPVTTIPASFAGTWKGEVVNTTRNASFPVEITFEAGGTTANAVYPREQCRGTLRLTRGTESALRMNLDISAPCTSGVVQITRQPDGTLQYTWNRPGTNLGYGGRLSRD